MKKFGKRMMAMTLAGVLALSPITAFAATGTTEVSSAEDAKGEAEGAGSLEGFLTDEDQVFSVTLPTDDSSSPTFKFAMDPQNLLNQTDSSNYSTTDTVLFSTKNGTSNELTITNNSQFDVDLSLTTTVSGLTGTGYAIKMASDSTFKDAESNAIKDTTLYLGLTYETATANGVDAVASTTEAVTDNGLTVKVTLGGMPNNYEPKKDTSTGKYSYAKISSPATATGVAKFKMTGACNPNGDWSGLSKATDAAPKVTVAWTLARHTDSYLSASTVSSSSNKVTATLPSGVSVQSVTLVKTTGATVALTSGTQYTYTAASNTLAFTANMLSGNVGGTLKVTYSDSHVDELTIQ